MATNYPSGYDSLNNPAASDPLDSSGTPHSSQHTNANDAIEAIQATLGLSPQGSYTTVSERIYEMGNESSVAAAAASAAAAADSESAAAASATSAASSAASVDATATTATEFRQFAADGSVLANLPARVHPAEQLLKQAVWWIDAAHSSASGQSVSNLGWGASALDARLGSASGADSNDPKFLDWDGENYVYLPGVGSNYLSVPDEAALDITGDIDVIARIRVDAGEGIMAKSNVFNQRSWEWRYSSGNGFSLELSSDGSTMTSVNAGAAFPYAFGETCWVRFTWEAASGDTKFYTQDDSLSEPSTWTQLGTTKTANIGSIYSGSAPVNIGARTSSVSNVTGAIHRAIIKDGIDGTPVLDVDTSQVTSGSDTSFTALTGQTVSINRSTSGRKSVAVTHPVWLFGTDDYMEVADNDLLDFGASDSFTVLAVVRQWDTSSLQTILAKKALTSSTAAGYWLLYNTGNVADNRVCDGVTQASGANNTVTSGDVFSLGFIRDTSTGTIANFLGSTIQTPYTDTTTGSFANSYELRIGSMGISTYYPDMELLAVAIFRRALTSGEIATLNSYFQGRA